MKHDAFARISAYILSVGGLIGFLAAFILTVEKIQLIQNPAFVPSCNLSPLLSCGSVMTTSQASIFGFPNSLIGVAGFAIVAAVGMGLLAGAKFKRWFWLGLQAGGLFGIVFIHWLFFQSVYVIGALCPYCMVVWAVTIPTFLYVTTYNLQSSRFKNLAQFFKQHIVEILVIWHLILIGLILVKFWDYWQTLWPF